MTSKTITENTEMLGTGRTRPPDKGKKVLQSDIVVEFVTVIRELINEINQNDVLLKVDLLKLCDSVVKLFPGEIRHKGNKTEIKMEISDGTYNFFLEVGFDSTGKLAQSIKLNRI